MSGFSRTEFLLLEALYKRDSGVLPDLKLQECPLDLKEKDSMNQIRELVFYIEKLDREGYIETEQDFYEDSDHMSFVYLNSATALNEEKIRLSEEGFSLMETYLKSHEKSKMISGIYKTAQTADGLRSLIVTGTIACAIGVLIGWMLGRGLI